MSNNTTRGGWMIDEWIDRYMSREDTIIPSLYSTLPYLRPQLFLGLKVPGDELLLVSGDDERLEETRGLVGVVE